MRFTLEIELGNDAMQSGENVAECINRVADKLWPINGTLIGGECGFARDLNGNTVGSWEVAK